MAIIIEKDLRCNPQIPSDGKERSRRANPSHREKYKIAMSPKNSANVSFLPDMVII